MHMEMIDGAAPAFPQNSFAVRIVHHNHRMVSFRKLYQGRKRRDISIHGKNTVGDDQRALCGSGRIMLFQLLLERRRSAMLIPYDRRSRKATSVNNRRVV